MQEIWKDIKGYVGLYQVSNLGRFKSLPRNTKNQYKYKERILKLSEDKDGYLLVNLNGKTFRSHVIVAQTFIKNDDNKPQINHIDGNKKNNNIDNLEWVTNRENIIHAYKNGLIKPMAHPKSIYSIDKYGNKEYFLSVYEASKKEKVAITAISNCLHERSKSCKGKKWKII